MRYFILIIVPFIIGCNNKSDSLNPRNIKDNVPHEMVFDSTEIANLIPHSFELDTTIINQQYNSDIEVVEELNPVSGNSSPIFYIGGPLILCFMGQDSIIQTKSFDIHHRSDKSNLGVLFDILTRFEYHCKYPNAKEYKTGKYTFFTAYPDHSGKPKKGLYNIYIDFEKLFSVSGYYRTKPFCQESTGIYVHMEDNNGFVISKIVGSNHYEDRPSWNAIGDLAAYWENSNINGVIPKKKEVFHKYRSKCSNTYSVFAIRDFRKVRLLQIGAPVW